MFRAFQARADVIVHLEGDTVPSPNAVAIVDPVTATKMMLSDIGDIDDGGSSHS